MTRNIKECIFCSSQQYSRGWTSDVIIARPSLTNLLRSVVDADDGGAKESLKSDTRSNSWAYHREMDVEVSQYLETECRHSIVPRDCPFNDVVPCLSFSPQLVYGARDVDSWVKFYLKEDRLTIEIEKSWYVLCLEEEGPFLFSNESLLDITGRIDKKNLNRDSMTLCRDICSIPDSLMDVCRNFRTWTYRTLSQSVSSFESRHIVDVW